MFIRKINCPGTTSVVVVDKSSGAFKELVAIGVSNDDGNIKDYCEEGRKWIAVHSVSRPNA